MGGTGGRGTDQHGDDRYESGGSAGAGIGSAEWASESHRGGQPVPRPPVFRYFRAVSAHFCSDPPAWQLCLV